jgi:hypothetical protein
MLYSLHGKLPTSNVVSAVQVIFLHGKLPTPNLVGAVHVLSLHGKLPTPNMVGAPSGPSLCLSSGSANNTNETANKLLLYLPCANLMQNWV